MAIQLDQSSGIDSMTGPVGRRYSHFSKTARTGALPSNFWPRTQKWATLPTVG